MRRPLGLILFAALLLPACGLLSLRPQAVPSRPAAPTSEITLVLNDPRGGFSIEVPASWSRLDEGTYPMVFSTQAASGTNLLEKRMEIDVRETIMHCRQSTYGGGQADVSRNAPDKQRRFPSCGAHASVHLRVDSATHLQRAGRIHHRAAPPPPGVYATEPLFDRSAE
jgi:hypothetical protein